MADTIREQIIQAYMTRLADWKTTNGYNKSCGDNAKRASTHVDTYPCCVLFPGTEENTEEYGRNVLKMSVRVEGFAEAPSVPGLSNSEIISQAQEQLLGDAIKIMTDPAFMPSLIDEVAYRAGGPESAQKSEDKVAAVFAEFEIKYQTELGNPYSQ